MKNYWPICWLLWSSWVGASTLRGQRNIKCAGRRRAIDPERAKRVLEKHGLVTIDALNKPFDPLFIMPCPDRVWECVGEHGGERVSKRLYVEGQGVKSSPGRSCKKTVFVRRFERKRLRKSVHFKNEYLIIKLKESWRRNRHMGRVIGIDLGTTNSVVSVMQGGEPTLLLTGRNQNNSISSGFTDKGKD